MKAGKNKQIIYIFAELNNDFTSFWVYTAPNPPIRQNSANET
jgi:hypothetical protein